MSRHEDSVFLRQMIDHIEEAAALARGRTREDLESDRLFFLGLLKLVEIVGEAATRVSKATQVAYSEIPWRESLGPVTSSFTDMTPWTATSCGR